MLVWTSGGNAKFRAGVAVPLRAVSGHRDAGFTSCPGAALYAQLSALARQTASKGLPKLYSPLVQGAIGAPVRFRARLSEPLPWTVTVTDATGTTVAGDAGTGQEIDWTWDASTAPPGLYSWTIGAGDTVRPATGRLGAKPAPLKITAAAASPRTVTPNGDGQTDSSQISYSLSAPATVTASLRAPDGTQLAVLFSEARLAGKQSFRFVPTDIPDGRYDIVLTAVDSLTTVVTVLPVLVDRTVGRVTTAPAAVSPDGGGVLDD